MENQSPNRISNRTIVLACTFVVILAALFAAWIPLRSRLYPAKFTLEVAPKSATVTLNDKKVRPGTLYVRPGEMNISVSKPGFDSQTRKITVKDGDNAYIGIALISNSPDTKDWYKNHSDDQVLLEKISGTNYNNDADSAVQQTPLISKLPYIGAGYEFRIDYGSPPETQTTKSKDQTAIYVTYYTAAGRQGAMDWIKQQGYDPTKLNIIFSDKPQSGDTGD